MQPASLEEPYFLSSDYLKIPSSIDLFEYGTGTSVSIEPKKDCVKPLESILEQQIPENSIILKPQEDIKLLENIYTFENPLDVRRFLWTHENLIEIVFEAYTQIKRIFGEEINLFLELHHDPEEDFEELFIVIKSLYEPKKTRELMDDLDRSWFLNIIDKTQGKLCITEEYL